MITLFTTVSGEPGPGHPDRGEFVRAIGPLLMGGVVIAVGATLASANDWSTGALWGVAVTATIVAGAAFAVPAARRAPSLRSTGPGGGNTMTIGARVTGHAATGELSPQRVIVLSGHSRSGKSTIAEQLIAQQPGWARASCGEYVRARARELGMALDLPNTHALGQRLVEELGGKGFLQAVLDHAQVAPDAENLVIDDVYHVAVFETLRERWQDLHFTTVDLPESIRRNLLTAQGLDEEQVEQIEESPLDQAVEQLESLYPPEVRLPGAANAADASAAIRGIRELLAA